VYKYISNKFKFNIDISDTILILTADRAIYKENTITLKNKMFITRESYDIYLDDLNTRLNIMGIDKLLIFVINNAIDSDKIGYIVSKENPNVIYYEMNTENFINSYLNNNENYRNFLDYSKHSMFIIKNSDFISVKNIFSKIDNCNVNMGRGGSQKAHGFSPLDLRLSSYIMAMFNFDFKLISYLNTFNFMEKERFLSWKDKINFRSVSLYKEYKPIIINKMPNYCNNEDLGQYNLECKN